MTANPVRRHHGPAAKFISQASADILARCYAGLVPAVVIEEALVEKALREGKVPPKTGRPA
ncbi:hypothetical protein ACIBAC_11390 [Streptomyces sp. NPDC051362]|uniref:hypothetical protein n=1 Tax=Streptomyces sp. NPDC051362 TaxID=3365651 RepID=UPI0037BB4D01